MKKIKLFLILLLSIQFLSAQERIVTGIVRDSIEVLPGANVVVKGTFKSTQTDMDGAYSIKATANDTLIFSYVGYKEKKVKADKTNLNPILHEGIKLKEVVGPPYYPKKKMNTTLLVTPVEKAALVQPKIQFETTNYDVGEIEQHKPLRMEIKFTNIGDKGLIIEQVITTDDSGIADRPRDPIMPGKSGSIYYKRNTAHPGRFSKTITVKTNDPLQPVIIVQVKGIIIAPR